MTPVRPSSLRGRDRTVRECIANDAKEAAAFSRRRLGGEQPEGRVGIGPSGALQHQELGPCRRHSLLPFIGVFGFVPLPGMLPVTVFAITALYVAATELTKRRFYSRCPLMRVN